ncbi:MAG: 2-oxo acid dehydrogenase subunit E2 [Chlorobi bacterium]|nr:2-oxo acid dehydrogenase subunit E2 [Chlorobiota bacterium]
MATAILMPVQGNTVESCLLLEWKKKKGDKVSKGDIICEVETDKAVFEVEAPEDGILLDMFFEEGDDIPVLTNIAVIGNEGEDYEDLRPTSESASEEVEQVEKEVEEKKEETKEPEIKEINITDSSKSRESVGVSPRAKRLAEQKGIDLSNATGSGPMGRIIERDIQNVINSSEPLTPAAKETMTSGDSIPTEGSGIGGRITSRDILLSSKKILKENVIKEEPIKGIRKIISDRMLESLQNSAQLTLNSSADASALLTLRETFKNGTLDSSFGKVNINDLIMYAVIKVLPNHPIINSLMLGNKIQYYENIHLGFAVDTPRGLMVPTIKNAQNYSLINFSNELKRLANACRENKIQVEELSGGTFTVTNLGSFGIDNFTPVINLPQTAILGVSRINLKPIQTDSEIKFVPHVGLSLTINHQVIDGVAGAKFLQDLAIAIKEINLLIAI